MVRVYFFRTKQGQHSCSGIQGKRIYRVSICLSFNFTSQSSAPLVISAVLRRPVMAYLYQVSQAEKMNTIIVLELWLSSQTKLFQIPLRSWWVRDCYGRQARDVHGWLWVNGSPLQHIELYVDTVVDRYIRSADEDHRARYIRYIQSPQGAERINFQKYCMVMRQGRLGRLGRAGRVNSS